MSNDDAPTSEPGTSPRHDAPPATNLADTDADEGAQLMQGGGGREQANVGSVVEESGKALGVMKEIPKFLEGFEVHANEKYYHIVSLFEKFQDLSQEGREDEKAATAAVQSAMTKVKQCVCREREVERGYPRLWCDCTRTIGSLLVTVPVRKRPGGTGCRRPWCGRLRGRLCSRACR